MLHKLYRRKLDFSTMVNVFDNIEIPLIRVLKTMEENGVAIDCNILGDISHLINAELKKLTEEIYTYAGYEFNLNSTQQLAKLLFEEKKLPNRKKTKTGFSTDNSVLEELAENFPIAATLIQYRQLSKLQSTYISALPKMINPETGRIHSSFNQTVASTGRLSSSNPNLQNIPVRTQLGREIRKAFCAKDAEHVILAADYSQIELRLLALMSKDEMLIQAFKNGQDIHKGTAAKIYNVPLEEVSQDQRRAAKTINFGILYGMGQRKLARDLGISQNEAKGIIESYFAQFPSIRNFIAQCVAKAHQERYCETIFGRRLYLPNINSKNPGLKSEAERVAVNMPIQGSAADIIKLAMLDIHAKIAANPYIKMILQVHDELVFEIHKDALDEAKQLVKTAMENALPQELRKIVELKTDIGVGKDWYQAH
jgi:DNA polymerase-1